MSREAMQKALEALELYQSKSSVQMFDEAITALRQALEEEREPLYWSVSTGWVYANDTSQVGTSIEVNWTPIYPEPPKREWVGLTDEEVSEIIGREIGFNSCWGPEEKFARAIEEKLRSKNG